MATAIVTFSALAAARGTHRLLAVHTAKPLVANASPIGADAVAVAAVGATADRTIQPGEACVAEADALLAIALVIAAVRTDELTAL